MSVVTRLGQGPVPSALPPCPQHCAASLEESAGVRGPPGGPAGAPPGPTAPPPRPELAGCGSTAVPLAGNADRQQGLAHSRARSFPEGSPRPRPGSLLRCGAGERQPRLESPARHEGLGGPRGRGQLLCRQLFPLGRVSQSIWRCLKHPRQDGARVDGAFGWPRQLQPHRRSALPCTRPAGIADPSPVPRHQ